MLDIALHIAENKFNEVDINKAQRGDVLYYEDEYDWDGTLGVCLGDKTMFNWKKSIMLIRNDRCMKCCENRMKIYNRIVYDKDNNILLEDSYEYTGPASPCWW